MQDEKRLFGGFRSETTPESIADDQGTREFIQKDRANDVDKSGHAARVFLESNASNVSFTSTQACKDPLLGLYHLRDLPPS